MSEITQDSLVKRSPTDQNRIARLEAKLDQLSELVSRNNEDNQRAAIRSADTNGRIASHFEDSKRVLDVVNAQGERLLAIEKEIVEINTKNQNLNEFVAGIRKAAWIGVTGGAGLLIYIVRLYLEHGAPLK